MPGLRSPGSLLRAAPLVVAAVALASPASAYRVFFDYDEDSNRGTFQNEAIGPDTVPVKIIVVLEEGDGAPPWIHFTIDWSCDDDFLLGRGSIANEVCCTYPTSFPFTRVHWEKCHLPSCWCDSSREFIADFRTPVPVGTWELTTLQLSRRGSTGKIHDRVDFWIDCSSCDYGADDDTRRSMTVRTEGATLEATPWGRTKSLYR